MNNSAENSLKKRVLFIGIPDMAYVCLDGLMASGVNIVGVMGAKKDHPTYQNFKNFVLERELNFIEYDSLKDADFIKKIKDLNADIAVVCSFNYKIPKVLLDSVKGGFVNVHPSLLPDYRGGNPYSTVLINDEKVTGVTLHFMDESFDTGDIIVQEKLYITPRETMGTLFNRLNLLGMEMLIRLLKEFETQELPRFPQNPEDFKPGKSLSDEDFFIDYNQPARDIERFIRALNPFFGASTFFRKTFVKILSAEHFPNVKTDVPCGTIIKIKDNRFFVKTQDGLIAPTAMQFGSFFSGTAKDFIDILAPNEGERFE